MPDLAADLLLHYGVEPAPATFALELDDRDALLNSPIEVQEARVFNWDWTREEYKDFYTQKEILKVLSNGVQHLRLYSPPGISVDLIATEPPVAIKALNKFNFNPNFATANAVASEFNRRLFSFQDVTKIPGVTVTQARPPKPVPPTTEFVGRKIDVVLDVIRFQNQRVAFQKYSYATGGFETAYASTFVTNDGRTIARPKWVPELGGAFVLNEPATGAIVIRYLVEYDLYKVNYGMASGIEFPEVQLAWLRGDIKTFPLPPVTVLAIAPTAGLVAEADFEKEVFPPGAYLASWETKGYQTAQQSTATLLSENSRTVVTRRITDPADESKFIDVEDAKTITLFDSESRPYTYRFAG